MRFHVAGLGAIGSLFAYHLRRTLSPTHEICLLHRSNSLAKKTIRDFPTIVSYERSGVVSSESGYTTEPIFTSHHVVYRRAPSAAAHTQHQTIPQAENGPPIQRMSRQIRASTRTAREIESLIVACKAPSTYEVLERLQHRLSPQSTVVLLQNGGLGIYEEIVEKLFRNPNNRPHFILVSINHGAFLKNDKHVVHTGLGSLHYGIVPDGQRDCEKSFYSKVEHPRTLELDDIARSDGDPLLERYRTLRNTVAVFNKISDLRPTWEPMDRMQVLSLASKVCGEASRCFRAEMDVIPALRGEGPGELHPLLTKWELMEECERVANSTAENYSSMLTGVLKGHRFSEVRYLNEYVVRLAARYSLPAPVNSALANMVNFRMSVPIDSCYWRS